MTDAINAGEVLNAQELDAVSGGLLALPLVAIKLARPSTGGYQTSGETGGTGGGQSDPAQMLFQQILQQLKGN
jgi:hypothetical protein